MSPVFSHGALRLYLLSLLQERPRHGYELIQALEERFGGTYSPSAGTIYPRLGKLEDDGLVTRTQDGRKVLYEITDTGRAELAARASELDGVEEQIQRSVRSLADDVRAGLDHAMLSLRAELKAAESEARSTARPAPASARDGNRARVSELEGDLAEFRAEVRQSLRAARDRVDIATAQQVRAELSRATSVIRTLLGE